MYNPDKHFLPRSKLSSLFSLVSSKPVDRSACALLQSFSEKFVADLVHRASVLSAHKKKNVVDAEDVMFVAEKEHDIVMGEGMVNSVRRAAAESHTAYVADISKQK